MNNNEAINLLLFMKRNVLPDTDDDEALDLAIKALKFVDENCPKTFINYLNGKQIWR